MKLNDYGAKAEQYLLDSYVYGEVDAQLMGQVLGLAGEAGEVLEKFKKILRDKGGKLSDTDKKEITKELGDVLWYVSVTAKLIGSNLDEVAAMNLDKLASRQVRDELHGSGDNR